MNEKFLVALLLMILVATSVVVLVIHYKDQRRLKEMSRYNKKLSENVKSMNFLSMHNDGDSACTTTIAITYFNYYNQNLIDVGKRT